MQLSGTYLTLRDMYEQFDVYPDGTIQEVAVLC